VFFVAYTAMAKEEGEIVQWKTKKTMVEKEEEAAAIARKKMAEIAALAKKTHTAPAGMKRKPPAPAPAPVAAAVADDDDGVVVAVQEKKAKPTRTDDKDEKLMAFRAARKAVKDYFESTTEDEDTPREHILRKGLRLLSDWRFAFQAWRGSLAEIQQPHIDIAIDAINRNIETMEESASL
jgi:hypothetical protein